MSLRRLRFVHVDVVTAVPFGGNQLAVLPQADGLAATPPVRAITA